MKSLEAKASRLFCFQALGETETPAPPLPGVALRPVRARFAARGRGPSHAGCAGREGPAGSARVRAVAVIFRLIGGGASAEVLARRFALPLASC